MGWPFEKTTCVELKRAFIDRGLVAGSKWFFHGKEKRPDFRWPFLLTYKILWLREHES
jgi:hypothetical protein